MAYKLIIGNKNYSSWSMRAWLLLEFLEIPYEEISISLYTAESRSEVRALGGETGLVPVLIDGDQAIWETPAIVEHLFETFPKVWPKSRNQRAKARSICSEVHSSMNYLRDAMPVNTRARFRLPKLSKDVCADVQRVVEIWEKCLNDSNGFWLFGDLSAADITFAPIATRFQTYGVELSGIARDYQHRILTQPLVAKWLALGARERDTIEVFERPFRGLEVS